MSGFLKTLQWVGARTPQRAPWGLDRNWHRSEAERHLKAGNLADAERHLTRVISPVDALQLVAKVMKVQPGAKPHRVGLVMPKAKDSNG